MASITSYADALTSLFTTINCGNAAFTMLFYDWLLCFDQEVACIWKARGGLNAGSLVYAFSRFSLIFGMVSNTATIFPMSPSLVIPRSCRFAIRAQSTFILLSRFSICMFSAFRVYAVSGRKVLPTIVVSLLSTIQIITSLIIYGGFTTVESLPSPFNCSDVVRLSSYWTFRSIVISRITISAAEAIVIVVTWRNRIHGLEGHHPRGETLGSILLRDGAILVLLNVLQIILTGVSVNEVTGNESYITIFLDPISSILTCRFILNLRQVDHSRMPSTISLGGDVHFAAQGARSTLPRFIASFGEPLHTAPATEEEGDEVEDIREDSNARQG
ncbi:hypothetical protein V8D89_002958 [Ganoderma adspersum]